MSFKFGNGDQLFKFSVGVIFVDIVINVSFDETVGDTQ